MNPTLKEIDLSLPEKTLAIRAICLHGGSDHPYPDLDTISGFSALYVYECLKKWWDAEEDDRKLVNAIDELSGRLWDELLEAVTPGRH